MLRILHPRQDAARLLAISIRKLDHLIKTKQINFIKIGKRTLIAQAELEKFALRGTGENGGRYAE